MNISLRQVKMDSDDAQTVFVTSTGTVLFSSRTVTLGARFRRSSTTVITSVGNQGSIVQAGVVEWNDGTGPPCVSVGVSRVSWRMIGHKDLFGIDVRARDGRIYRWRKTENVTIFSAHSATSGPVAVAYDDGQSPTVDPAGTSIVLCIKPTGFHLLHEIVVTFVLFERLCRYRFAAIRRCMLPEDPQSQLAKDDDKWTCRTHVHPTVLRRHDVPSLRTPRRLVRSTADLTGELLRRYKYPSAYGGYGDIWKCDWLKDARVIEVAVKVMRTSLAAGQKETERKRISRELKVWMKLEHECVLPLYGISFDFGTFPAMVCPWLESGTLSKYLERHQGLLLSTRLQLLSDVANGLHYLHGCGIVHGDLTGSNVLIKDNGKACLSDFGLSRVFMEGTGSYLTSTVRGSVRWAAPELFELGDNDQAPTHVLPSPESDVYSFGSTMLQVLTGRIPYHYYKNDAMVLVALSRGTRPARPEDPPVDDVHWAFMQLCWSRRSTGKSKWQKVRPSIEEVVDFLSVARARCM